MLWRRRGALLFTFLLAAGMSDYYLALFLPHAEASRAAYQADRGFAFGADFYPVWLASRECIWQRRNPYSADTTREIQRALFGREINAGSPADPAADYRAFSYPAFVAIVDLPLAWLPFPTARIVLLVILVCLTAASLHLWARALQWQIDLAWLMVFIVLTLTSYPGLEGLFAEQAGLIVAFLLAGSVAALAAHRTVVAGCLLALATVKPQMCLLVILYLLLWTLANWRERWKLAAGFAATLAALMLSALFVWPNWIGDWVHVLMSYRHYSRPPLLGYFFGVHAGIGLSVILLAAVGARAWKNRQAESESPNFRLMIAILLAVTAVSMLPEHAVYDHVILLPGTMLLVRSWREMWKRRAMRWLLILAAGALLWPWTTACIVVLTRAVTPRVASKMLFLPLRTAAAVPFIVLALLFLRTRANVRFAPSSS